MLIPKAEKHKNKKHLIFVASQECCLNVISADWCSGNVQAHHLLKPFQGKRGMGMRASDKMLCHYVIITMHNYMIVKEMKISFGNLLDCLKTLVA